MKEKGLYQTMEPQEPGKTTRVPVEKETTGCQVNEDEEQPEHDPHYIPDWILVNGPPNPGRTGKENNSANPGLKHSGQDARTTQKRVHTMDQPKAAAPVTGTEKKKKTSTARRPVIAHPVDDVDRKTELHGMSSSPFLENPSRVRKRTERDIKDPEFEIPYARTEKAVRDLVCCLIERQDRMNVSLFLELNTMKEDIGMLKDQVFKLKTMKSGTGGGAKK